MANRKHYVVIPGIKNNERLWDYYRKTPSAFPGFSSKPSSAIRTKSLGDHLVKNGWKKIESAYEVQYRKPQLGVVS